MPFLGLPNETIYDILEHQEKKTLRAVALTSHRLYHIAVPLLFRNVTIHDAKKHASLAAVLQQRKALGNYVKVFTIREPPSLIFEAEEGEVEDQGSEAMNPTIPAQTVTWCHKDAAYVVSSILDVLDLMPNLHTIELLRWHSSALFIYIHMQVTSRPAGFPCAGLRNLTCLTLQDIQNDVMLQALLACMSLPALQTLLLKEAYSHLHNDQHRPSDERFAALRGSSTIVDLSLEILSTSTRTMAEIIAIPRGLRKLTFRFSFLLSPPSANDIVRALEGSTSRETLRTLNLHVPGWSPSFSKFRGLQSLQTDWRLRSREMISVPMFPVGLQDLDLRVWPNSHSLDALEEILEAKDVNSPSLRRLRVRWHFAREDHDARFQKVCHIAGIAFTSYTRH